VGAARIREGCRNGPIQEHKSLRIVYKDYMPVKDDVAEKRRVKYKVELWGLMDPASGSQIYKDEIS
jgi:hypothetical protein